MANSERGVKRQCLNCSTKFYDLNRDPILCPSCSTLFVVEAARPTPVAPAKEKEEKKTDEADVDEAAVVAGAEVVSLDNLEDDDDDDDDDNGDDIPDVEDVEVDDELSGENNDVFLEDDDDDDDIGIEVVKPDDDT